MAYTVEINGVNKTSSVRAGSLRIAKGADNRNDCSLSIFTTASALGSTDGAVAGQDLKIKEGSTVIFGGVIKTARIAKIEPGMGTSKKLQLDITSNGYGDIPSRRFTTSNYVNKYAGEVVTAMVTSVLNASGANEHITMGTIEYGAYLLEYSVVCKSVKGVLDELAEASGFKWHIDDSKALHFVQEDTITNAAHDLVESGTFKDFDILGVDISLENYRNKQFITGTTDETGATVYTAVEDATEITARQTAEGSANSSGVYGDLIDSSDVWNEADATAACNNGLKRYGVIPYTLTFTSFTNDWEAGSKLKANLPTFGIGSDTYFLIESVEIDDIDGINFQSTVTATRRKASDFSTQRTEDFKDYFAKMVKGSKQGKGGGSSSGGGIFIVHGDNAAAVTVGSSAEVVAATTSIPFTERSKALIHFSCKIDATAAANLTAKVYVDGTALTFQPTQYYASGDVFTFSFHAHKGAIAYGTKTIEVKLQTDANGGSIAIGHALLTVIVAPDPMPGTYDPTTFTATAISASQIDLAWTNPTAAGFVENEVYRSTSDLAYKDRAWCNANATAVYNGTATTKSDTGLAASTKYYYKLFAEYSIAGETTYSSGQVASATTPASPYQQWDGYPDTPDLSTNYPVQYIATGGSMTVLYLHHHAGDSLPDLFMGENNLKIWGFGPFRNYWLNGGVWTSWNANGSASRTYNNDYLNVVETNQDIYSDSSGGAIYVHKTT